MHAIWSLTSAYAKLGHIQNKNNCVMYMTIELSQLMLNLYVVSSAESFSHHTVDMLSLCGYYDLYGLPIRGASCEWWRSAGSHRGEGRKKIWARGLHKKILGPIFICGQQLWILYETKKINFLKKKLFSDFQWLQKFFWNSKFGWNLLTWPLGAPQKNPNERCPHSYTV